MKHLRSNLLARLAFCALLLALAGCHRKELPPEVGRMIQATVGSKSLPAALRGQKDLGQVWNEMRSFYTKRDFQPAWFNPKGHARPQVKKLLAAIDPMVDEALDPHRYGKDQLVAMLDQVQQHRNLDDPADQLQLAHADMQLTYTFLTMAAHLASGRLQPDTLHIEWYTKPRRSDLDTRLSQALEDRISLAETLRAYTPPAPDYARLRGALSRYHGIAEHGGWAPVGITLKPGTRGEPVRRLRARLGVEGDLAASVPAQDVYDPPLAAAVSHFQRRHGLDPTGTVDADTLAELDLPVDRRIRQIELNLERWRWLPSDFGQRYIRVNIPDFALQLVEGGRPVLAMRVIVGKAQRNRTPVFSDKMTYLVLNPTWNLPDEIVENEIRPELAKDPGYLERKNLEVVQGWDEDAQPLDPHSVDLASLGARGSDLRLRQPPGPDNPLGQVKFGLPNQYDIYLHDTPADHLFKATERDFSHGCIRLERPWDLARYLLQDDPKWTPEALQEAVATGETKTVLLRHPLPVHILYFTTWVDPDGTVQFRRDIYSRDAQLDQALAQEPPSILDFDAGPGQLKAEVGRQERQPGQPSTIHLR